MTDPRIAIKFGDVVTLAADGGGFLHGNARIGCFVDKQRRPDSSLTCHNFQECCFRIVPKLQYSSQKACERRVRHAGIREVNLSNWQEKLDPQNPDNADIIQYFKSVLDEQDGNNLERDTSRGVPVLAGSVVQLLHVPSGKFLTQLRNRAINDRLAMEIGLDPGRKGSWWKVKGSDGATAEGKPFLYGDRVVLESVKFVDSFVSLESDEAGSGEPALFSDGFETEQGSQKTLWEQLTLLHPTTSCRKEVTASANACAFRVNAFSLWNDRAEETDSGSEAAGNSVRGMSGVILSRRQDQELLVALPGQHSAGWAARGAVTKSGGSGVAVRALWRVVPRAVRLAGQPLALRSAPVLLQSLESGLYLSAGRGGKVAMTPQLHREGTAWTISSLRAGVGGAELMADGEAVKVSAALGERAGLDFLARSKPVGRAAKAEGGGEGGGEEHGAVHAARLCEGGGDMLEVQLVDAALLALVDKVHACKTLLLGLQRALQGGGQRLEEGGEEGAREAMASLVEEAGERVGAAVAEVAGVCGGKESEAGRRVVRELGLLQLAMALLDVILAPYTAEQAADAAGVHLGIPKGVRTVCSLLYGLVERACWESRESGALLLPLTPLMSRHLPAEVGSYRALLQAYSTSGELLGALPDSLFALLCARLERLRDPATVNLVIQCCSCNGVPVRHNQNRWVKHILLENPQLFLRTRVQGSELLLEREGVHGFVASAKELVRGGQDSILAQIQGHAAPSAADSLAWVLPYHVSMLRLLQAVLAGRNTFARQAILEKAEGLGLSCEALLRVVESEATPVVLLAECSRLLGALYVDVEPHRAVPSIMRVRTWAALMKRQNGGGGGCADEEGEEAAVSAAEAARLKGMVARAVQRLGGAGAHGSSSAAGFFREDYLGGVVQLFAKLLRFGFYHARAGEENGSLRIAFWQAAQLKELERLPEQLFEAVGTGLTALHAKGAHTVLAELQQQMIVSNAEAVLQVMKDLLHLGINHQVSRVVAFWEKRVSAAPVPIHQPATPTSRNSHLSHKDESCVAASSGNSKSLARSKTLRRFGTMPRWRLEVGEGAGAEGELMAELRENPLMPLIALANLTEISPQTPPRVLRILFSLIAARSRGTTESAFDFLISIFYQRHALCSTLATVQVVVNPQLAAKLAALHRQTLALRRHVRQVVAARSEGEAEGELWESGGWQAMQECQQILILWTRECEAAQSEDQVGELQNALHNFNVPAILLTILQTPVDTAPPQRPGELRHARSEGLKQLLSSAYRVLGLLCISRQQHNKALVKQHEALLWQHAEIEGVNPECAMLEIAQGASSSVKGWVKRTLGLMEKFKVVRPCWVRLLRMLVSSNPNEGRALLGELQETVAQPLKMVRNWGDWDERAELLGVEGREEDGLEGHVESVELLAAVSANENPAAQILASSHISCRTVLNTLASATLKSSADLPSSAVPRRLMRVKAAHLRFLRAVYAKTEVRRLFEELHSEQGGLWAPVRGAPPRTGMEVLLEELRAGVQIQSSEQGWSEESADLVFGALLAMLCAYFEAPETLPLKEKQNRDTASALMEAAKQLSLTKANAKFAKPESISAWIGWQRRAVEAIAGRLRLQADTRWLAWLEQQQASEAATALVEEGQGQYLRELRSDFAGLCEHISAELMNEADKAVLPRLLSSDEQLEAVDDCPALSYAQVVSEIAAASRFADSDAADTTLLDKLLSLRLAIYTSKPPGWEEVEEAVEQFRSAVPLQRKAEEVKWIQHKFDGLGCTAAGMRLCLHPNKRVHAEALRLLLLLLQGANRKVQKSALATLRVSGSLLEGWFKASSDVLRSATRKLAKWNKEGQGGAGAKESGGAEPGWVTGSSQSGLDDGVVEEEEALGRQGRLMLLLRLLELLCKNQCVEWQELMVRQHVSTSSYDLLQLSVELLKTLQPMLQSSQNASHHQLLVLAMQTVETITSMVQGPHRSSQQAILATDFLATVNRLMSGVVYVANTSLPVREGRRVWSLHPASRSAAATLGHCQHPHLHTILSTSSDDNHPRASLEGVPASMSLQNELTGLPSESQAFSAAEDGGPALNDLRCWFRTALLRCLFAFFEVPKDTQVPERVLGALNLNSIVNKIVSAGDNLLLTETSRREWKATRPMKHLHLHKSRDTDTWRWNVERRLGFSPGFEASVEEEMLLNFSLLQNLRDFDSSGDVNKIFLDLKKSQTRLWTYLDEHTSHVELSRRVDGGVWVDKVYFPVDSSAVLLSKSTDFKALMDLRILQVPSANSVEKYRDLLKMLKQMVRQLEWLQYISSFQWMRFVIRYRGTINHAPLYLTVIITLLLLLFYGLPMDPNTGNILADGRFFVPNERVPPAGYEPEAYPFANKTSDPEGLGATYGDVMMMADLSLKFRLRLESRWDSAAEWGFLPWMRAVILFLGILHAALTAFGGLTLLVLDFPLAWAESTQEVLDEAQKKRVEMEGRGGASTGQVSSSEHRDGPWQWASSSSFKVTTLQRTGSLPPPMADHKEVWVNPVWVLWRSLKREPEVMAWTTFLVISALGVASSPILFVFCLFDYFRLPGGQMVFRALRTGAPALFRTFLIGLIIIVCWGFMGYVYFSQTAIIADDTCHSPFQCITKQILDSLKGDITTVFGNFFAYSFPGLVVWADNWFAWRSLVLLSFIICWSFLLQPVITGQIIDAFMQLRNSQKDATKEMEEKCFISGVDRFKLDGIPGEWAGRRKGQYTWNYLFFLFWLLVQDEETLGSIHLEVLEKVRKDTPDFFPSGICAAIQRQGLSDQTDGWQDSKPDHVHERLDQQQQRIDQLFALLSSVDGTLKRLEGGAVAEESMDAE